MRSTAPSPRQTSVWTLQRASIIGLAAGGCALPLAAALNRFPDNAVYLYAALLALTLFCGASILWITTFDMKRRGTSGRMRPIRVFDIAIGVALLIPAAYALWRIWPRLGL